MFLRLTALGTVQEVHMTTQAGLAPDYSLIDFEFDLISSGFHFHSRGRVNGRNLLVEIQTPQSERTLSIPLSAPPYLPAGILDTALAADLRPGASMTLSLFDPATLGNAPVTLTNTGPETIEVDELKHHVHHYTIELKGATQHAWMDGQGNLWRQEGILGLVLVQTSRKAALKMDHAAPSGDIIHSVSIPVSNRLQDLSRLEKLVVAIQGIDSHQDALDGGRQRYSNNQLTILKEKIPDSARQHRAYRRSRSHTEFLKSTPFMQVNHPRIKALISKIVSKQDSALAKVHKIMAWMAASIDQRPVFSLPSALPVLDHGVGDCNEHAILLATLCRAAGIPARVEAGLVYQNGRFYYHAWNSVYLGRWITADPVLNQLPADVTHIRMAQGADNLYFDLMGIIGKVTLKIIDTDFTSYGDHTTER
jgi:hypothetical protein